MCKKIGTIYIYIYKLNIILKYCYIKCTNAMFSSKKNSDVDSDIFKVLFIYLFIFLIFLIYIKKTTYIYYMSKQYYSYFGKKYFR